MNGELNALLETSAKKAANAATPKRTPTPRGIIIDIILGMTSSLKAPLVAISIHLALLYSTK